MIGFIDWAHYKFVGGLEWTTELFPLANLSVLLGHVGSAVLVYFASTATNDSGVTGQSLPKTISISSVVIGSILCVLTFLEIGLDGGQSANLGPAPPMREQPGGEVASL